MFKPKWLNPNFVLVRINREKQKAKRERIGRFILPPSQIQMRYNQQCGEVVMIGRNITRTDVEPQQIVLPMLQEGDELFFQHSVEGSVLSTEDKVRNPLSRDSEYENILYEDAEWRYYVVRSYLIFGCRKPDGQIFTAGNIILAIAAPGEQDDRDLKAIEVKDKDGQIQKMWLFRNYKEERAVIEKRLEQMKQEATTHKERAPLIMEEMERLTASLNRSRAATFMPVFVPARAHRDFGMQLDTTHCIFYMVIGRFDTVPQVTQIEIDAKPNPINFFVLRYDYVLAAKKLRMFEDKEETVSLQQVVREWEQKQETERLKLENRSDQMNLLIRNEKKLFS